MGTETFSVLQDKERKKTIFNSQSLNQPSMGQCLEEGAYALVNASESQDEAKQKGKMESRLRTLAKARGQKRIIIIAATTLVSLICLMIIVILWCARNDKECKIYTYTYFF